MGIPNIKIGDEFWCHACMPRFGFWGELRRMVRDNMTLYRAIEFHNEETFQFKHGFTHIPLTHEIPHQLIAIAAVYNPRFRFLLPEIDPKTGFLKPNGYNGFSDGEDLVTSIEHGLLKAIVYQKFKAPDLSKGAFMQQIDQLIANAKNLKPKKLDYASWIIADQNDKPTSAHEVKKSFEYDHSDLMRAMRKIPKEQRPPSSIGAENSHKETIPFSRRFDRADYEALYDTLIPAVEYLNEVFVQRDGDVTKLKKVWGDIDIRKLHKLVGGEKAAHEYFCRCGVPEYQPNKNTAVKAAL